MVPKADTVLVSSLRKMIHSFEYIKSMCNRFWRLSFLIFMELYQGIPEAYYGLQMWNNLGWWFSLLKLVFQSWALQTTISVRVSFTCKAWPFWALGTSSKETDGVRMIDYRVLAWAVHWGVTSPTPHPAFHCFLKSFPNVIIL